MIMLMMAFRIMITMIIRRTIMMTRTGINIIMTMVMVMVMVMARHM